MQEEKLTPYVMFETLQTVNANLQNQQKSLDELKNFA